VVQSLERYKTKFSAMASQHGHGWRTNCNTSTWRTEWDLWTWSLL